MTAFDPLATHIQEEEQPTFRSLFFSNDHAIDLKVPNYQRAYSWEKKQNQLFLDDLIKYEGKKGYYFGHFIVEEANQIWEIVDGQQRITTFVLFLMVCRHLSTSDSNNSLFSIIDRFSTVSYDMEALEKICQNLGAFLDKNSNAQKLADDSNFANDLALTSPLTRSQHRIIEALIQFHQAFLNKVLLLEKITSYIEVVISAYCSLHVTYDKSVAVNIFEMHNTRGVPLTTLEIIKAKLMKFVYDNGNRQQVVDIQKEFGEIYKMEEIMIERSFRGEMTTDQLLRLHLMVVDDNKRGLQNSQVPPPAFNSSAEILIQYIESRLHFENEAKYQRKDFDLGIQYALDLAKELRISVSIVSHVLFEWDKHNALVGDVMILEKELSCQFFLLVCRKLQTAHDKADGRLSKTTLALWEKLLFTRDFHGAYHGKAYRDNFNELFSNLNSSDEEIQQLINTYLADGFRSRDVTKNLQSIVHTHINDNKEKILKKAYHWWKNKMIYAIYKYEISQAPDLRSVMRDSISLEHILSQSWQWEWVQGLDIKDDLQKEQTLKEVSNYIHGIGNLLLVTASANSSIGNHHPSEKNYTMYISGGSYEKHYQDREHWKTSSKWPELIRERGEAIYKFMMEELIDHSKIPSNQNLEEKT